jgi:hypothetical protein
MRDVNKASAIHEEQHLRPRVFVVRRTVETTLRPPGISLGRGESCAGWTLLGLGSLQACEYRDNSVSVGAIGRPGIIELLRSEAT